MKRKQEISIIINNLVIKLNHLTEKSEDKKLFLNSTNIVGKPLLKKIIKLSKEIEAYSDELSSIDHQEKKDKCDNL